MIEFETERLILRRLQLDDADFIIELLNDPDFIKNIADRGVRNQEEAEQYLINGPMKSYETYGHGMYLVENKAAVPMGLCGIIKRSGLDDIDLGFAFLPQFRGHGYAFEAAHSILGEAKIKLNRRRLLAIVNPDNQASIRLLEKLGMHYDRKVILPSESIEISLYQINFDH